MPTERPLSLNVPHCTERPARPRSPLVLNARHNLFVAPVKRARRVLGKKERLIPMSKKTRINFKNGNADYCNAQLYYSKGLASG